MGMSVCSIRASFFVNNFFEHNSVSDMHFKSTLIYYLGWVSVAKNQKDCGSCSAFAQMGMAESSLLKAGAKKDSLDLSEDWLINCRTDGAKDVCAGAHITIYAEYMIKTKKFIHEKTSPYMTQKGSDLGPCLTKHYWSPGYKFTKTVAQWSKFK